MIVAASLVFALTCTAFNFLVGNWFVKDVAGRAVGTESVTKDDGGCTLIEKWRGVTARDVGLAVITYQPAQKLWHRDALLRSASLLEFDGRTTGGSMFMTAKQYSESGLTRVHRITWTPNTDGSIRELWQSSTDIGNSWQVRFDDVLTRIAE